MSNSPSSRVNRGIWLGAAVIVGVAVPLLVFGFRVGECIDYAPESAAVSSCRSGPAVGIAGAWVLCVAAALFVTYLLYRALRPPVRR
ncbi:hypothetical protein [Pengzhenrongella sp.]|jgi:hypothetical protein|uniref:hypothetical protein n=1 Tax=Pengzhenrongella sp. TaxID=2888820 RepID=UPI002F944033